MEKVVFFEEREDLCCGEVYRAFLKYAFERTDYFMLVYQTQRGMKTTPEKRSIRKVLAPFRVKSRNNPSWPGTTIIDGPKTDYKIVFYRTDPAAMEVLLQVKRMSDWDGYPYPEDLSFFKGDQCWFYSVGHEIIAGIIHPSKEDIKFVFELGLARPEYVRTYSHSFYDRFDEELVKYDKKAQKNQQQSGDGSMTS